MNVRIWLLALATAFVWSCDKDSKPADIASDFPIVDTISVMSYNIAGLPQGISSGDPVNNTSEIGRRINAYDIVQVQEDFNYNQFLYGTARHPFKTTPSGPVPFGDGLNTLSRYKITHLKRLKWRDCNGTDCLTPKGFTYSQIEIAKVLSLTSIICMPMPEALSLI
jgi:hypothetical protein